RVRSAVVARLAHGRRHGYDSSSIREPAASRFYDVKHRIARDLHAIARNRLLTGLALGYRPDGAAAFGLSRKDIGTPTGAPYGILLHATARPGKERPRPSWLPLARARAWPGARGARHFAVAAVGKRGGACAQQAHRRGACECPRARSASARPHGGADGRSILRHRRGYGAHPSRRGAWRAARRNLHG